MLDTWICSSLRRRRCFDTDFRRRIPAGVVVVQAGRSAGNRYGLRCRHRYLHGMRCAVSKERLGARDMQSAFFLRPKEVKAGPSVSL